MVASEKSEVILYEIATRNNSVVTRFMQEFRYLGHTITSDMRDDSDIKREIRNMYAPNAH